MNVLYETVGQRCFVECLVVQESDMELDLLGDSESDSEESAHSHADNASVQRSAITAATAGSDAGLW